MPNERISMSKLKQLVGLKSSNLSVRALARALGIVARISCRSNGRPEHTALLCLLQRAVDRDPPPLPTPTSAMAPDR